MMTDAIATKAKAETQASCSHDFPKWRKAKLRRCTWARRCRVCRWTEYSTTDPSSAEVFEKAAERFAPLMKRLAER
jgi:hypothetical protein